MAVLIDKDTRVICQGFTGARTAPSIRHRHWPMARRWWAASRPARAAELHLGLPGLRHRGGCRATPQAPTPRSSMCRRRSPAMPSWKRSMPAVALIVCITEGIPVMDMVRVKRALSGSEVAPGGPELSGGNHRRGNARSASCPGHIHTPEAGSGWCRARAR